MCKDGMIDIPPPPEFPEQGMSGQEYVSLVSPGQGGQQTPQYSPAPSLMPQQQGSAPMDMAMESHRQQFMNKIASEFPGVPQNILEKTVARTLKKRIEKGAI